MANLSNINNKFLVTTGGNVLIGQTAAVGTSKLQVTGNATFAGNVIIHNSSNAPYIDFVENADTGDSKARITMDQIDTNNGTLFFATENAGTLFNQVKITQTGNLLLSNDAASFNTSNAKLNVLPASSGVYQQWNYSPSNDNFSLKLKETVTVGNVRYVFEQINNTTTYPNTLVFNQGSIGIGTDDPDYTLHLLKSSGDTEMYINGQNGQSSLRMGLDARNWQIKTAAAPYLWSLNYVGTDVPLSNIITATVGGNVGIGQTNPQFGLSMAQGTGDRNRIGWNDGAGDKRASIICSSSTDALQFHTGTSDTEKMRILSNGRLLVGFASNSSLNDVKAQFSTGSGSSTDVSVGIFNNGTAPTTSASTTLALGFIYAADDYVPTGITLGKIQFLGQANDAGYGAGSIQSIVTTGGNTGRSSHAVDMVFSTKPAGNTGNVERMRIKNTGAIEIKGSSTTASAQAFITNDNSLLTIGSSVSGSVVKDIQFSSPSAMMYIDGSTANVGIGTTSPDEKLDITGGYLKFNGGDYGIKGSAGLTYYATSEHYFYTGGTERMRIDSSGNTTFLGNVYLKKASNQGQLFFGTADNQYEIFGGGMWGYIGYNTGGYHRFFTSGTERMRITSSGTIFMHGLGGYTSSNADVRYATSSKELYYQTSSKRYKTNIVNLENSLDKIDSLRPVRYVDINTKEPACGLIAEETVEIIPEVVFTKEIEGFDKPQVEGINYSDLVPFLIKSIQELKAEIELLKNK